MFGGGARAGGGRAGTDAPLAREWGGAEGEEKKSGGWCGVSLHKKREIAARSVSREGMPESEDGGMRDAGGGGGDHGGAQTPRQKGRGKGQLGKNAAERRSEGRARSGAKSGGGAEAFFPLASDERPATRLRLTCPSRARGTPCACPSTTASRPGAGATRRWASPTASKPSCWAGTCSRRRATRSR